MSTTSAIDHRTKREHVTNLRFPEPLLPAGVAAGCPKLKPVPKRVGSGAALTANLGSSKDTTSPSFQPRERERESNEG